MCHFFDKVCLKVINIQNLILDRDESLYVRHTQGVGRNDKLFGFQSGGLLDAGSCSKLGTAFGIFDTHKAYLTSLFQGCHVFIKLTWDNNSHFSIFNMEFLSEEKNLYGIT